MQCRKMAIKFSVPTGAPVRAAVAAQRRGRSWQDRMMVSFTRCAATERYCQSFRPAMRSIGTDHRPQGQGAVWFARDRLYALTVDGQLLWQVPV